MHDQTCIIQSNRIGLCYSVVTFLHR